MSSLDQLLSAKVVQEKPKAIPEGGLSPEQFELLSKEVEELKTRISSGEIISVKEAAKITVWFRARRVKNFTVAVAKAKPKARKAAVPKRKVLKAEEKQALSDALINSL